MKHVRETRRDVGAPAAIERCLVAVAACAAALLMDTRSPASAASPKDCRSFHEECAEARAAGYRDVGICNVERLECPTDHDARVPKPSYGLRDNDQDDHERSFGGRPIGP